MASVFPTTQDSFITNVDNVDIVTAADINNLQDSIVAIESTMGTGSPASALAVANSLVRRDVEGITYYNDYYAVIGSTVGTPIGSTAGTGTWTAIAYDTVRKQVGGIWMAQYPSVFFAIKSGLMTITAHLSYPANATGWRGLAIAINGGNFISRKIENAASSPAIHHMETSRTWPMVAGDYFQVFGVQNSGVTLTTEVESAVTPEVTVFYQ